MIRHSTSAQVCIGHCDTSVKSAWHVTHAFVHQREEILSHTTSKTYKFDACARPCTCASANARQMRLQTHTRVCKHKHIHEHTHTHIPQRYSNYPNCLSPIQHTMEVNTALCNIVASLFNNFLLRTIKNKHF